MEEGAKALHADLLFGITDWRTKPALMLLERDPLHVAATSGPGLAEERVVLGAERVLDGHGADVARLP